MLGNDGYSSSTRSSATQSTYMAIPNGNKTFGGEEVVVGNERSTDYREGVYVDLLILKIISLYFFRGRTSRHEIEF
jgi:hypothetical protein